MYKYVESPDFEILLFGYAYDNDKVKYLDLANGDIVPNFLKIAILSSEIVKRAWNAAFEIVCLEKYLNTDLDVTQWQCTMIGATMIGLPASLAQAGLSLNLDTVKDTTGKALVKLFCQPIKLKGKPTEANLFTQFTTPKNSAKTHPDKWKAFINYLITDVEQERKIANKIDPLVEKAFTEEERYIWWIDHKINKRGIKVDQSFTKKCIKFAEEQKHKCMTEAIKLTKLANPNSTAQIKGWLEAAIGESIESLNKKHIPGIKDKAMDGVTERVIELRQELSKSSIKKYNTIIASVCEDGRVKGLHKYYGASKTGRWGSSGVQIHNLKRNELKNLDAARKVVNDHSLEDLENYFDEGPQEILSQLIRTAFIAKEGCSLLMSDFSSIEARITAWLAGEEWRMKIFNTHGKIYEESASRMFKIPIKEVTKESKYRAKGKIAELALGFGGGVDALTRMGGEDMGLTITEMKGIVRLWRITSPHIVTYWKEIEDCAIKSVRLKGRPVSHKFGVQFQVENNILWLRLPSGRFIAYREPRIEQRWVENLEAMKDTITYVGMEQTRQKITRLHTYGGKLTENIVQGTARDLLATALVNLTKAKFDVVLHVHDEAVIEERDEKIASSVIKINKIMAERPSWAKTLPLSAETTVSKFYKK